ncbi:MAG: septum formation initiator family protein [Ferruginibacter sp.]
METDFNNIADTDTSGKSGRLKSLSFLKNKYLLTGILFLVWMFFFNEKDLVSEFKRKGKYKELQKSEQRLSEIIKDTRQELGQLKTNAQTIEKYAREKYLMKKDNEDLFVLPAKDDNK